MKLAFETFKLTTSKKKLIQMTRFAPDSHHAAKCVDFVKLHIICFRQFFASHASYLQPPIASELARALHSDLAEEMSTMSIIQCFPLLSSQMNQLHKFNRKNCIQQKASFRFPSASIVPKADCLVSSDFEVSCDKNKEAQLLSFNQLQAGNKRPRTTLAVRFSS